MGWKALQTQFTEEKTILAAEKLQTHKKAFILIYDTGHKALSVAVINLFCSSEHGAPFPTAWALWNWTAIDNAPEREPNLKAVIPHCAVNHDLIWEHLEIRLAFLCTYPWLSRLTPLQILKTSLSWCTFDIQVLKNVHPNLTIYEPWLFPDMSCSELSKMVGFLLCFLLTSSL